MCCDNNIIIMSAETVCVLPYKELMSVFAVLIGLLIIIVLVLILCLYIRQRRVRKGENKTNFIVILYSYYIL